MMTAGAVVTSSVVMIVAERLAPGDRRVRAAVLKRDESLSLVRMSGATMPPTRIYSSTEQYVMLTARRFLLA